MRKFDVVVIGAGAAGLMAAGVAAGDGHRVLLCEKMEKTARKVRITGKGRCNLTNMRSEKEFLSKIKTGSDFFRSAFKSFSNLDTIRFFEEIDVPLTVERGERVFPTSSKAWDIAIALTAWADRQGALIECHKRVTHIDIQNGKVYGIEIDDLGQSSGNEYISCRNVIISTGGASYPATGSTGDGYRMAHEASHRIEPIRPSLVPLEGDGSFYIRDRLTLRNVSVSLSIDSEQVAEEFGEVELENAVLGGAAILRLSRMAVDALIDGHDVTITIDLKTALSDQRLRDRIVREKNALQPNSKTAELMRKLLPGSLVIPFLKYVSIPPYATLKQTGNKECDRIVKGLKSLKFKIIDYRPFEEAIVTAGGIDTTQIDPLTMQSRLVEGLYFAGEVMDIDADTGGYNLQIAFSTGHLAGKLNK